MIETQTIPASSSLSQEQDPDHHSAEQRLIMQYHIARILAESNSISKAAGQVLQLICETAGWEFGALWRIEPESQSLTNEGVWHGHAADLSEYAEAIHYSILNANEVSMPGYVLHSTQLLWLSNLENFRSADASEAEKAGLNSGFLLPILSSGKLIAILEFLTRRIQSQDRYLVEMLNAVGNQIGIFLERKILEETLATRANQQHILAQAGISLSTSLNYEDRLNSFMHVTVPDLADWCAIDLIDRHNLLRRVAAAHIDPAKTPLIYALQPTRIIDFSQENRPQVQTLLSGQSLLYTDIAMPLIEKSLENPEHLDLVRQLDPRSCMVIPLMARERILGICTFVQADSRRRYLPSDLVLAEDIGRRLALALDNAILYAESQQYNSALEQRVNERTAQLKVAISQLENQISERKNAEEQIRVLNAELEHRIAERTSQLEVANRELHKEIQEHELASKDLRTLLRRTRELYRISQAIGAVRNPSEALGILLSSSYLKNASRASIAILNRPWLKGETPPENCYILAEWNKAVERPRFIERTFTLKEYGIIPPVPYGQPIVIPDIQSIPQLPLSVRARFSDLHTKSLIILPLIANGEWYGLLSLHFSSRRMPGLDDLRHVRGLVDETAIAIQNVRLLEAESRARQEAEAANELKLKFLAMISHELRTPLASIKGFATTLLSEDVVWSADKQLDFLQTIDSEADKLSDLIEQLLDLSRMEAGILRISPKKQVLHQIAASALVQLRAVSIEHELVLDLPPDLPPIIGDEQRIAQVLTNLVGNAAKYSPAKTLITVSAHPSGDKVRVDIADQGIGIPLKERTQIFEAFHQLKNRSGGSMRGAGMGLAICKGLIEAQGGTIWIQDHPGPGTVVSFTLPIASERPRTAEG